MYHQYTKRTKPKRMAEINVVPYIDVLLVLLIIFMVTIPLMNQSVTVELPKAHTGLTDKITQIPIILIIDKDNKFYLNTFKGSKVSLNNNDVVQHVAAHLQHAKTQNKHKDVMLRAHKDVDYQTILDGIMLLKKAGAPNVGLMTVAESSR